MCLPPMTFRTDGRGHKSEMSAPTPTPADWQARLSVLARRPNPQHEELVPLDFIAHVMVPTQDTANLARIELLKPPAHARLYEQATGRGNPRLDGTRHGGCIERRQRPMQPRQIRCRTAGSIQIHHCGAGMGASVSRPAAQACTADWSMSAPAHIRQRFQREAAALFFLVQPGRQRLLQDAATRALHAGGHLADLLRQRQRHTSGKHLGLHGHSMTLRSNRGDWI